MSMKQILVMKQRVDFSRIESLLDGVSTSDTNRAYGTEAPNQNARANDSPPNKKSNLLTTKFRKKGDLQNALQIVLMASKRAKSIVFDNKTPTPLASMENGRGVLISCNAIKEGSQCPFCFRTFTRNWLLKNHIRTHTKEKPFTCEHPGCGKSFSDKSNLRAHTKTHSKTKDFKCPMCNRQFKLKSYLSKHLGSHQIKYK